MTLRLEKCRFMQTKIEYLRHQIDGEEIRPGAYKIKTVAEYFPPKNIHKVRGFLGLVSYSRKFIKKFAILAKPLTNLTKEAIFQWEKGEQDVFVELREKLVTGPVLAIYDPQAETEVQTDASKWGVGANFFKNRQTDLLILYYSILVKLAEQNYRSYELETIAVVSALQKLKVYIIKKPFNVITNCNALRTTLTKRDLVPRIARWWLATQEFDLQYKTVPGCKISHVDTLNRNPHKQRDNFDDIQIYIKMTGYQQHNYVTKSVERYMPF